MAEIKAKKVILKNRDGERLIPYTNSCGGLKIGQIGIAPLGIDETLNLERYLNGQIIIQDQFKSFTSFLKKRVALYPNIACQEEEWQTIVANSDFSQCGKFVIDDEAGTIRLPKITGFIQGLNDLASLGSLVEAGLPNITGSLGGTVQWSGPDGAFGYGEKNAASGVNSGGYGCDTKNFDASRSNPIYGNSDTVQPESIQYPYFIQVATGAETEDNIINEIELNNPFVLLEGKYFETPVYNVSWLQSNTSFTGSLALQPSAYNALLIEQNANIEVGTTVNNYTKRGISVKLTSETYTDFDFVLDTENQTFRCPTRLATTNRYLVEKKEPTADDTTWYNLYSDGWCEQGGKHTATANTNTTITLIKQFNNTDYSLLLTGTYENAGGQYAVQEQSKSSRETSSFVVRIGGYSGTQDSCYWQASGYVKIPTENNKLYYYVGETVQNANLINAGRIEEKLAGKADKSELQPLKTAYITETYKNGTSWYRVYSDGWCEQGGSTAYAVTATVTLAKPYIDASYTAVATIYDVENCIGCVISSKSATGFSISSGGHGGNHWNASGVKYWIASGYIA